MADRRKPLAGAALAILLLAGCSPAPQPVTYAAQSAAPPLAADPGVGYVGLVDGDWARSVADATGIPLLAVLAYAGATIRAAEVFPDCGIGWNTLAGIGLVESDHGRHGGSSIQPDFTVSPSIFGVALDGGDTDHIPDSDGGAVDGDTEFDRAVGPMQLIPQTWASWPSDGDGDGNPDPQNIADAAIAAAHHMCRAAGELTSEPGFRAGIAAYNSATNYLEAVASAAKRYAEEASEE